MYNMASVMLHPKLITLTRKVTCIYTFHILSHVGFLERLHLLLYSPHVRVSHVRSIKKSHAEYWLFAVTTKYRPKGAAAC